MNRITGTSCTAFLIGSQDIYNLLIHHNSVGKGNDVSKNGRLRNYRNSLFIFSIKAIRKLTKKIVRFSILRILEIDQKIPEIWVVVFQGKQLNLGKNSVF